MNIDNLDIKHTSTAYTQVKNIDSYKLLQF